MKRVVLLNKVEEVSVLKKNKKSIAAYKRNGWVQIYEGKFGLTLQKTVKKGI